MVGQLVVAQFDLETAIAALTRSGGDAVTALTQLHNITQLRQQIGTASTTALAALRSEIVAAVAQSQSAVQEARTAAHGADGEGAGLASLASRAQSQATAFMRDLRQYDSLLQFKNDAERDAYRQREEDRRRQHDAWIAEGGPEGALKASGAAYGQAVDLAVHGGSADPALLRRVDELAASTAALRAGMIREGKDVSKFDENMRDDLRAIMRSKGKSDAEIDALLAAHPDNPIEAMKSYVAESDIARLNQSVINATSATNTTSEPANGMKEANIPTHTPGLDSIMANLQTAGITVSEVTSSAEPIHGVTASATSPGSLARQV